MTDKDFRELVKVCVDKLKEDTVHEIAGKDPEYQNILQQEQISEDAFQALNLTPEQRKICDDFIDWRDKHDYEYATFAYIAGMYDALRITRLFFLGEQLEKQT